eukprot:m.217095 g.217095  ORF g.217095 m.217095 type:complete len:1703 (-) comp15596_c5_seq5:18-5126(-)
MAASAVQLTGVSFSTYSKDEIRQLSVKRIVNPVTFDNMLHPTLGGLYDPALGPIDQKDRCTTCSLLGAHCPGHVGHIELPFPVFNPMFFNRMFALLRATCRYCHTLLVVRPQIQLIRAQLILLDHGLLVQAREMSTLFDRDISSGGGAGEDGEGEEEKAKKRAPSAAQWLDMIKSELETYLTAAGIAPDQLPDFRANSTQVDTYRRELAKQVLALCSGVKKCPSCGGIRRRLTQEHHARIHVLPLNSREREMMAVKGKQELSFIEGYVTPLAEKRPETNGTASDSGSDSESEKEEEEEEEEEGGNEFEDKTEVKKEHEKKKGTASTPAKTAADDRYHMTPMEAFEHLRRLWENENEIMTMLFRELVLDSKAGFSARTSPEIFFVFVLPVAPSRFRPASKLGDKTFENPQTTMLQKVLQDCKELYDTTAGLKTADRDTAEGLRLLNRQYNAWQALQLHVNLLMDSSLDPKAHGNNDITRGIRQTLERKEGLFRMHMMGKRVNYAARSVISPDPMIGTHEIGVPEVFALRLSYPEPVTTFNVAHLRSLVLNGPACHPGATHIEDENGNMIELGPNASEREALADQLLTPQAGATGVSCKKVLRHIRSGDWVLVNRQPTLHKSSIMAHQVRVLRGERTLRLHYANCKTYNADFDGDEMNMHFPQNEIARAEAGNIACTDYQYCALDGSPLRGLIQDHIVAGFDLTCRDTLLDRDTYQHLVYACLKDNYDGRKIITQPPCLLKPRVLWSGKQVVTTVLQNITAGYVGLNMRFGAKIRNKWSQGYDGLEGEDLVIVRNGELLAGVLDKNQCGATANGLIHACYEVYGGRVASEVLSAFGRLFTAYLKFNSISLGVDDILLTPTADAARRKVIDKAVMAGFNAACDFAKVDPSLEGEEKQAALTQALEAVLRDPARAAGLDSAMMRAADKYQTELIGATVPNGLMKQFPRNVLQLIIQSGAKGSNVNATQISSLLGQQALEGRRVPVMISGKSLPSFPAYDPSLRAGGMIFDRFLTGLKPQEFYFHCMAGREGLVDTAVKTSRSGYLQRCLVKHLEDLRVNYDLTVRDADGSVIQFLYGDDGMDVTKTKQLQNFGFMGSNYHALLDTLCASDLEYAFPGKFSTKAMKHTLKAIAKPASNEPSLARYRPDRFFGSVSESLYRNLKAYIDADKEHLFTVPGPNGLLTKEKLEQLIYLKCVRTLADPGENVGVLAAQALGEPSTQMTLNTFHFAGRSDMNVTLGIPRLREILMTASQKIKTPLMRCPLSAGPTALEGATKLSASLHRVTLADVLDTVDVTHQLAKTDHSRARLYHIRFNFLDASEYNERFHLSVTELFAYIERTMIAKLVSAAMKAASGASSRNIDNALDVVKGLDGEGKGKKGQEEDEAGDEDDEGTEKQTKSHDDNDSDAASDREDVGTLKKPSAESGAYDEDDGDKGSDAEGSDPSDAESAGSGSEDESDDSGTAAAVSMAVDEPKSSEKKDPSASRRTRIANVKALHNAIYAYDFDPEGEWCSLTLQFDCDTDRLLLVSLIENIAPKLIVRATAGIKRCALSKSRDELEHPDHLDVEGINLVEMWKHCRVLDIDKLSSNDIWAIHAIYGVEAARATMIRELSGVFQVYGIAVDHRHLSLITDFMTFEGEIRAMNRIGMRSSVAPFHKMSFETSTDFLRSAAMEGSHDCLKSHSSRLVVGRLSGGGTGAHSLLHPLAV